MKENRCIVCGKDRTGLQVREDYIISTVRWLKRNITRSEKGYTLVVCRDCYKQYEKGRHTYERRRITYVALGVVAAALWIVLSEGKLGGIVAGILLVAFMYLLSLLSYAPALATEGAKEPKAGNKRKVRSREA